MSSFWKDFIFLIWKQKKTAVEISQTVKRKRSGRLLLGWCRFHLNLQQQQQRRRRQFTTKTETSELKLWWDPTGLQLFCADMENEESDWIFHLIDFHFRCSLSRYKSTWVHTCTVVHSSLKRYDTWETWSYIRWRRLIVSCSSFGGWFIFNAPLAQNSLELGRCSSRFLVLVGRSLNSWWSC